MLRKKPLQRDDFHRFVIEWNNLFFFDLIFRKKYKLPFLGEEHRNMPILGMFYDYLEDKLLKEHYKKVERERESKENQLLGLKGLSDTSVNMSAKELDDEFENLDLTEVDEQTDKHLSE